MRNKLKRILVAMLMMLLALTAGIFTACNVEKSEEELIKEKGYTFCVTYDANGGSFGANTLTTYALVKESSLAPAPGYEDKNKAGVKLPTRRNYRLIGGEPKTNEASISSKCWYLAQTAEDGTVLRDEDGNALLASDTPWNFAKDKVTSDITLVAVWEEVYRYVICVQEVDENGKTVDKELRIFLVQPGATIANRLYKQGDDGYVDRADYIRINESDYTLLDFYMDAGLTQDLDFNYVHPGQREVEETVIDPVTNEPVTQTVKTNDVKIYAKYLSGKYELLTQEVVDDDKPSLSTNSRWYLLEDVDLTYTNVITGRTERTVWDKLDSFEGAIYGNGYSISGFEVRSETIKPEAGKEYRAHSIFGQINGVLSDVTFKEGVFKVGVLNAFVENVIGEQRISFLAYGIGASGTVKGVTVEDCQIVYEYRDKYEARINEAAGAIFYEVPADSKHTYKIVKDGAESNCITLTEAQ